MLPSVSQFEVDFVIPRVGVDLPLGIDPFLLFKSRDARLGALHGWILEAFNRGVAAVASGDLSTARTVFTYPEVSEIGLGYAKSGKHGSGLGSHLRELIVETLADAPLLRERGIRHVEEMQLVSAGIGPDRVSDIVANILKLFLIEYTQGQAALWKLPVRRAVPVEHILDPETHAWFDGHFDLPVSPIDDSPVLFVPRRIVRQLPWINYEDFYRREFAAFHRARRVRQRLGGSIAPAVDSQKAVITTVARREVERVDRYIAQKEASAADAQPSLGYLQDDQVCAEAALLQQRLRAIDTGAALAGNYQRLVLEILNFLFSPELIDGAMEVRTIDGTERRDIMFTNDSDRTFWTYVRNEHSAVVLMFEAKNTGELSSTHINQVATYLGDRIGRLGFIATRHPATAANIKKTHTVFNDSHPRKVILVLCDTDFKAMLDIRCQGQDPMRYLQRLYRAFRTGVQ